jgi:hypothetical protein
MAYTTHQLVGTVVRQEWSQKEGPVSGRSVLVTVKLTPLVEEDFETLVAARALLGESVVLVSVTTEDAADVDALVNP